VKDDSLAPRVLAEGGAIGFLEHAGGVLLLRLAVLELRQHLHHVPDEGAVLPWGAERFASAARMAFDLLELDGRDLRREPLKVRRRLLERLVRSHGMIFATRRLSRNGLKAWEEALARGFEGIVAKNPESRYVPGRTWPGSR